MDEQRWSAVDDYISEQLIPHDPVLDTVLREADAAGLPRINVAPTQGGLLHLLALAVGARRILEIGTLAGYSTIWLARALPEGGRLVTLEADGKHARVARANIARAGLDQVVELREGAALDTLPVLASQGWAPFDLVFIDADKPSNAEYFTRAVELSRPGSMIVVDNVIRGGAVIDADSEDPTVLGTRKLTEVIAAEPRVRATEIQTVGAKGYDGFALAVVTTAP